MRNLRHIHHNSWQVPADLDGEPLSSSCWDPAKNEILCTFGPSATDGYIRLVRLSEHVNATHPQIASDQIASWEALSPNPDLPIDRVVSLHHFSDNLTTILVLEGGDIVLVREYENAQDGVHIEIMGSIDEGIAAASWSPDEELLAIATKAQTVVFMSRNFDSISDATMTPEDLRLSKQVSVGWGKKETQFQGRGAKALRDPTIPEKVDQGTLSPQDDGRVTISWRGDGAYIAINSIEPGSRRVIRVYSRDGVLDSVSEAVDGMEGALSWRPAGNLIASIQRKTTSVDVIFFERNGLRHGDFALRAPGARDLSLDKIGLEWNSDSTVLAVTLNDRVQFWATGNYHWYLKQEILTEDKPVDFKWHSEKALQFSIATPDKLLLGEFVFAVSRGSLAPPNDYGAVVVIDGRTLKITPFRTANVPPPMALFEVETRSAISDVEFSPDNMYMAVLHQSGIDLYRWQLNGQRSLCPTLESSITFPATEGTTIPLQISVNNAGEIIALIFGLGPELLRYALDASSGQLSQDSRSEAGFIYGFSASASMTPDSGVIALDRHRRFHQVQHESVRPLSLNVPAQLPWCTTVGFDDEGSLVVHGLSRNGHLYANRRLLAKNCTSYLVTPDHLIFTTTNHLVKFVHRTNVEDMEVPPDDPEKDERCRSVERGARLVTAIATNMSLVLQMPRGNLETIFPRAMVLAGIRKLIEEHDYTKAFLHCRTQRVDMNILYDHKPEQFLESVPLFLEQLQDVAHIDLFLSSLREEDVTQTMYVNTKPSKEAQAPRVTDEVVASPTRGISKVNTICNAVLRSLQSRRTKDHGTLQNIITSNVCKNPPALEDGLLVVANLMQEDEKLAESAVEHICFLADVNTLYDEALGLYNLDLTLLVAQQSQRDPREYLPFIQSLHQLSELRRKFTIDDHLGRHGKALAHLQTLDAHQEAQDYIVKHSLYADALRLYRYDAPNLTTITRLYATFLESRSRFREAGLTYESLQDYASATRAYRASGISSWREALFTATLQSPPLSVEAMTDLANTLADALYEAKDYVAGATIHLEHLKSVDTAVRWLCKGYHFADALRLSALHKRPDLLASAVDPGLADALGSTTEFLADCKAQLRAQVPRILELRRKAAEDPLAFYEGERAGGGDLPDDVSVAASSRVSTSASLFTRYTGKNGSVGTVGTGVSRATSKNRKREEKKRARGRKGTVYEEEYLVNSVRRLVERVNSTKAEMERLVFGLVRRGMFERARTVEALMAEVLEGCRKAISEVFVAAAKEQGSGEGAATDGEGAGHQGEEWRPMGADAVLSENLEAKWKTQAPPLVTAMERLSLLGS
ncbi:IKI3 family protein [Xylariales sp. PMI_506]|nr:IKI3 family protein [Xylariales sp. PMI_506]